MNYLLDTDTCIYLMTEREPKKQARIVAHLEAVKPDESVYLSSITVSGPLDTLIASHAVSLGATLITNNTREFARVSGLHVKNWSAV